MNKFSLTTKINKLIKDIERIVLNSENQISKKDLLKLRKRYRILSLQSTTAIEGNTLTIEEVTAIVNGKKILALPNEIDEIKNINEAYLNIDKYDYLNIDDLLKSHSFITNNLINEAGLFRTVNVGVYAGNVCIHQGCSPNKIKDEITNLFAFLNISDLHILIKSCIFHFELEFIHPFSDGNGRSGRLWQTVILNNYNKLFRYLPIETVIYENQQKYYQVLNHCSLNKDSTLFVEFMLEVILKSLKKYIDKNVTVNVPVKSVLELIKSNKNVTVDELADQLKKNRRTILRYIKKLKDEGKLKRIGSNKNGCWEII
jgi:Fic family protein